MLLEGRRPHHPAARREQTLEAHLTATQASPCQSSCGVLSRAPKRVMQMGPLWTLLLHWLRRACLPSTLEVVAMECERTAVSRRRDLWSGRKVKNPATLKFSSCLLSGDYARSAGQPRAKEVEERRDEALGGRILRLKLSALEPLQALTCSSDEVPVSTLEI
jgi:hypothetical protein